MEFELGLKLEEERILASGRTKIPGLKARIELAWQKEREEQQRLLQETATLARDLRQTLYEVGHVPIIYDKHKYNCIKNISHTNGYIHIYLLDFVLCEGKICTLVYMWACIYQLVSRCVFLVKGREGA